MRCCDCRSAAAAVATRLLCRRNRIPRYYGNSAIVHFNPGGAAPSRSSGAYPFAKQFFYKHQRDEIGLLVSRVKRHHRVIFTHSVPRKPPIPCHACTSASRVPHPCTRPYLAPHIRPLPAYPPFRSRVRACHAMRRTPQVRRRLSPCRTRALRGPLVRQSRRGPRCLDSVALVS